MNIHTQLAIASAYIAGEPAGVQVQENAAIAADALYDIGVSIPVGGIRNHVMFEVTNVGAHALANFALLIDVAGNGVWHTLLSGTDWAGSEDVDMLQIKPSATIQTLAQNGCVITCVNFHYAKAIKFQAQAGTSNVCDIQVRGTVYDK